MLMYVRREIIKGTFYSAKFIKVILYCLKYIFISKNYFFAVITTDKLSNFILFKYIYTLYSNK